MKQIVSLIVRLYVSMFARNSFAKFNKLLYRLSLGGLGVLNYKTTSASGERAFLKSCLTGESGVLIDVGANKGSYTKEALKINPNIKVYAFEPHPITYSRLVENIDDHQAVTLINKGLSGAAGSVNLYDYSNKDGSVHASLFEEVITELHKEKDVVAHKVDLITLDEFVDNEQISEISLLKIDAEGNELEILKGGSRALSENKIKVIHFEFNEMNVASRCFFRDFWTLLEGYKLYRLLPNGMLEIKQYNPIYCEIFAYQNIVAFRKN